MSRKNNPAVKASVAAENGVLGVQTEKPTPETEKNITDNTADAFSGVYKTSTALNIREQANASGRILGVLNVGTTVECNGRYAMDNGTRYLYVTANLDGGVTLEGYCHVRFLIKQ